MNMLISRLFWDLERNQLEFNNRRLDLSACPLMLKLFKVMTASPNLTRKRCEVLAEIYGTSNSLSERLMRSHRHNLVKLVSRSRALAKKRLDGAEASNGDDRGLFRWFLYDKEEDSWTLMVPRSNHHPDATSGH